MTRAQAIERAIDESDPGDEIVIHAEFCDNASICCCTPISVFVGGEPLKAPLGFRRRDANPEA